MNYLTLEDIKTFCPTNSIINADCLEAMKYIADNSIDLILCDPPYQLIDLEWDKMLPLESMWKQYNRIIKENGVIVLTASQPFTSKLVMSNSKMFRYEWIWQKTVGGGFLNCNYAPLKRHENILVFSKSKSLYNPQKVAGTPYSVKRSYGGHFLGNADQTRLIGWETKNEGSRYPTSVLSFNSETGYHPTQKPTKLFSYLILTYTNENDLVLDSCIGSGTTALACIDTNRRFIGIEKEEKYCKIAIERISQL